MNSSAIPLSAAAARPVPDAGSRMLELDLLRFLAINGMFLLHVLATWWQASDIPPRIRGLAQFAHDAAQFCVPVLFLISLVLMAQRQQHQAREPSARRSGLRMKELMVPTFTWMGLLWLVGVVLHLQGLSSIWLLRIPLGQHPLAALVLVVHLWFMLVLMQLTPLFPKVSERVNRFTQGSLFRASALLVAVFLLKALLCLYMFHPARAHLGGWMGLMAPFWLDLMILATVWPRLEALLPQQPSARTSLLAGAGVLLAGALNLLEIRFLVSLGTPEMLAHSNLRPSNLLYSVALFSFVIIHRESIHRRLSGRVGRFLQRFSRNYSYAFYLAHVLPLSFAALLVQAWGLGPAPRLLGLLLLTLAGTGALLYLLQHVPRVGTWLGVRRADSETGGVRHGS